MSYSVIIPLDCDANIIIEKEDNIVALPQGSILIMGGNQKHAGGGYPEQDYPEGSLRLFFFLNTEVWPPCEDITFNIER
jgi:hypothetical protein